jgi:bifunctional UDP-N-acetylglucosamine pyrophosphorylase/glucosamine-1-phosphate N-acetyltransferase
MKAVILAAGRGTRLHPITLTRPKHLVPICGKPLLDHLLKAIKQSGIDDVLLVVNYLASQIKDYLGDGKGWGLRLHYAIQESLKGTADAARYAEHFVKEDFLLTYGDWLITTKALTQVIDKHEKEKPTATMAVIPVTNPEPYGVVKIKGGSIQDIVEKPSYREAPTNLANAGTYVLSPEIFDSIKRTEPSARGELEITDSLLLLLQEGHSIGAAQLAGEEMFDVGLIWDLLGANRWALKRAGSKRKGSIEDGTQLIGPVVVEAGSRIRSGAYVEGPVFIGRHSDIGPNCYIRPYTSIGQYVRIGNACEIKNSVIMDKTHIGHLSYVGDSVIGENCNLGAGTTIANYRFDSKTVNMRVRSKVLDTGRKKLGVIFGDEVKTGVDSAFMPGVKVGNGCWIGPGVLVYRDVSPRTVVLLQQKLETRKMAKTA